MRTKFTPTKAADETTNGTRGPTSTIETITPEIAQEWLARNENNRSVRPQRVELYANDMQLGRWHYTADPIRWARDGSLLDGQHRLLACIKANTAFTTLVVRGLDPSCMTAIDSGAARNPADVLGWAGIPNAKTVAPMVKAIIAFDGGFLNDWKKIGLISRQDQMQFALEENAAVQEAVSVGYAIWRELGGSRATWAAYAYIIERAGGATWLHKLHTGEGLYDGDPRLTFRKWVLNRHTRQARALRADGYIYTGIRVWNAHVEGRKLHRVLIWELPAPRPEPLVIDEYR